VRLNLMTTSSFWLSPSVSTDTTPSWGRDLDSRMSSTVLREWMVSPSNTGCGSRTSSQPRFAKTFWDTSVTLCPETSASVNVELTRGLPNSVRAAYSWSKCSGAVFCVSSVNQMLSVLVTVRPSGCS
jgi:hypothetical protein